MEPVAVITGGAGGMGLATARIMGRDHRVVISDVNEERLDAAVDALAAAEIKAQAVLCDITDRHAVADVFRQAQALGTVRTVVHTAGISPQMGPPELIMRINVMGTVQVTEAAFAIANEGFAVVHVASLAAHLLPRLLTPTRAYKLALTDPERAFAKLVSRANRGPRAMRAGSAYSISKGFVRWYAREQAARFGAKGARILSVSPGSFDTAMGRLEEKTGSAKMVEYAALKRFGTPEEIAELLAFCASPKAGYLTGTDILCDGGTRAGIDGKALIEIARGRGSGH